MTGMVRQQRGGVGIINTVRKKTVRPCLFPGFVVFLSSGKVFSTLLLLQKTSCNLPFNRKASFYPRLTKCRHRSRASPSGEASRTPTHLRLRFCSRMARKHHARPGTGRGQGLVLPTEGQPRPTLPCSWPLYMLDLQALVWQARRILWRWELMTGYLRGHHFSWATSTEERSWRKECACSRVMVKMRRMQFRPWYMHADRCSQLWWSEQFWGDFVSAFSF